VTDIACLWRQLRALYTPVPPYRYQSTPAIVTVVEKCIIGTSSVDLCASLACHNFCQFSTYFAEPPSLWSTFYVLTTYFSGKN